MDNNTTLQERVDAIINGKGPAPLTSKIIQQQIADMQRYVAEQGIPWLGIGQSIGLDGATTAPFKKEYLTTTLMRESNMTASTDLNKELNPAPVQKEIRLACEVDDLEQKKAKLENEISTINAIQTSKGVAQLGLGYTTVHLREQFSNRYMKIVADQRKLVEEEYNEVCNTLDKIRKLL